jgi:hypothetical protein
LRSIGQEGLFEISKSRFRLKIHSLGTTVSRNGGNKDYESSRSVFVLSAFECCLEVVIDRRLAVKGGTGPADALYIDDIPVPPVSGNQALVNIKAFGLNRMDLLQREGQYPLPPQAPETMGVEFSGTIEDLGPDANGDFKVGDEVFGLAYGGQLTKPAIRLTTADDSMHRGLCSVHVSVY